MGSGHTPVVGWVVVRRRRVVALYAVAAACRLGRRWNRRVTLTLHDVAVRWPLGRWQPPLLESTALDVHASAPVPYHFQGRKVLPYPVSLHNITSTPIVRSPSSTVFLNRQHNVCIQLNCSSHLEQFTFYNVRTAPSISQRFLTLPKDQYCYWLTATVRGYDVNKCTYCLFTCILNSHWCT